MRIVTVSADHCRGTNALIRTNRVRGQLQTIGALPIVTVEAHFSLSCLRFHRVGRCVQAMTSHTPGVIALVHAAGPGKADVIVVTTHTHSVLIGHRRCGVSAKIDDGAVHIGGFAAPGVRAAGSVAAFTLQLRHRRLWVRLLAVRCTEYHQHVFSVMAAQAGIRAGGTVILLRRFNVLTAYRPRGKNQ